MQSLTKYSVGDWIYGVVASLIARALSSLPLSLFSVGFGIGYGTSLQNIAEAIRLPASSRSSCIVATSSEPTSIRCRAASFSSSHVASRCLSLASSSSPWALSSAGLQTSTLPFIYLSAWRSGCLWKLPVGLTLDGLKDRSTTWMRRHSLTPRLSWGRHPTRFEVTLSTQRSNQTMQSTAGRRTGFTFDD